MSVSPDRHGIPVAVIQNGVILSYGTCDFCGFPVADDWERKQMFPLLGEHFRGDPPCRAVDLGIGGSLKPCNGKRIQRAVVVWIYAIFDKAVLDISYNILDLALRLRIAPSAHIYSEPALLTEFFKLRCVNNIAVVFRHTD